MEALTYMREDRLSDECKKLIPTLPSEKGWIGETMYLYEGFWYLPVFMEGVLGSRKNFQAQGSDTILATSPKSGTTWLMAMAYALLNRSRFGLGHNDGQDHPLLTTNPHDLVPILELALYSDANKVPDLSSHAAPRIFGTHMPFGSLPKSVKDSSCKVVYLCRNPKDMFVSMYHFLNKLKHEDTSAVDLDDMFDKFCDGKSPFGPFWDHALGYWKESLERPDKVLFVKYEDLKGQPADQLRRLAEFLGCSFSQEEERRGVVEDVLRLCSFDRLSNLEVNKSGRLLHGQPKSSFFRKGKVGDWSNLLTSEMSQKMDRVTESKLGDSGLKF